ncbi:hypothetical protein BH11ACT5_BH11ACT5_06960 [soil metagenome]
MTLPPIILARELARLGMDRWLRNELARGAVHRVIRGAYVRAADFEQLDADERYRLIVSATAQVLPETQFSRESAAALWRLPTFGRWPTDVHATVARSTGGRSGSLVQRHGFGLDPLAAEIDGVIVTSLARTLAEVACGPSFVRAVVMLDDGLRTPSEGDFREGQAKVSKERVLDEIEKLVGLPGRRRGREALDFADGRAGSPGESVSRVQFRALGLPIPELQVPFYDRRGLIGVTDYYWPDLGLAGEFDGDSKYGDGRRFGKELSPQQIVIDEKKREDRLRAVVSDVVRWDWAVALNRRELAALLSSHGLRPAGRK